MRRIAIACGKGGSSKTTTATALSVCLARRGHKVLLIDADQSSNATWTMTGGQGIAGPSLADVLTRRAAVEDVIVPSTVEGLDLLPASSALGGANVALSQELARDTRLRSAMSAVEDDYDFAIADTGPSFTTILANCLVWAHEVIVACDPGVYAMLGLVELESTVAEVKEAYGNHELHIAGLVLCRVARNNTHRDVEAELRSRFGSKVFASTIPLAAVVEQAHTNARTVVEFAPKSPASLGYLALTDEIERLNNGRTTKDRRGGRTVRRSGESAA